MKGTRQKHLTKLLKAASDYDAWTYFEEQTASGNAVKLSNPIISLDLQIIQNVYNSGLDRKVSREAKSLSLDMPEFTCPPRGYLIGRETGTFLCFSPEIVSPDKLIDALSDVEDVYEVWELKDDQIVSTAIY